MSAKLKVPDLVESNNINIEELYDTYMNNGKNYTAARFNLSN